MLETELTRKLNIQYPIFLAPMAGGPTTAELIAAVSNAGGVGNLGAGYLTADQIRTAIKDIRRLTDSPFGVNLFVPEEAQPSEHTVNQMNDYLNKYRSKLGITLNPLISNPAQSFEDQVNVLLEENVSIVSFTFGIPPLGVIQAFKQRGATVIGTATTVEEGIHWQAVGVDAVVAQGSEAGGHRGTFASSTTHSLIGTMALVPQLVDHLSIPVIASGGIMDGRGLVASLTLGASAVQMGTAFLTSFESGAHPAHKEKILLSHEDSTEVTYVYSGKAARGIRNEFMDDMRFCSEVIPHYPIQNALTRDIRQAAAELNNPEFMSLWAGQGLRLAAGYQSAADIVQQTMEQAHDVLRKFNPIERK